MIKMILAAILFTGCATTLPQSKREGMRSKLAHNSRCMDYEECDRAVKR